MRTSCSTPWCRTSRVRHICMGFGTRSATSAEWNCPTRPGSRSAPTKPLSERELDSLTETLLWGGPYDVNAALMQLFRRGAGILDIGDAVKVCFQRYLIDVLD